MAGTILQPLLRLCWIAIFALALLPPASAMPLAPEPSSGPPEQLRRALAASVAQAFAHSAQLRSAEAQLDAALADVEWGQSQRMPQVQLRGQSRAKDLGGGLAVLEGSQQSLSVDVVTTLWDWGKVAHALDSQRFSATAADAQLLLTRQELAYQVVTTQVELARQQALVKLSEQYREWMAARVAMLEQVVAADRGRALELLQARSRLMQADEALRAARLRGQDADLALRRFAGPDPARPPRLDHWPLAPAALEPLLARVPDHPRVRAAQAQGHGERAKADSIGAATLPQVDWEIGKSTYQDSRGLEQPWHTRLSMSWTPFDGGASRAARRSAMARSLAAEEGAQELLQQLSHQVQQADQTARAAVDRSRFYAELALQSGQIRQAFFEQWYHLGQRTLLDVLSADSEHYGHLSSAVVSRFDGYLALVQGMHAAGVLLAWLRDGVEPAAALGARLPELS